jgi:alkylation response protein AidB-like acyl-CoA dehydrogenase
MSRSATSRSTSRSPWRRTRSARFAADVVAPQAEAIHRDNLTVPEALLQALRELGVFGLSIPSATAAAGPTTMTTRR